MCRRTAIASDKVDNNKVKMSSARWYTIVKISEVAQQKTKQMYENALQIKNDHHVLGHLLLLLHIYGCECILFCICFMQHAC